MTYQFTLTEHAIQRGRERFGVAPDELTRRLNVSRNIGARLRQELRSTTMSDRHYKKLQRGSGFLYRIHQEIVFVLDNLSVVTVFEAPDWAIAAKQAGKVPS